MTTKNRAKTTTQTATTTWELVTPEIAQKFIESMGPNRRVVQKHVDYLAQAMKNGEWVESAGDPVRFNEQGELIDGQHRLWAIIETGMSFHFNIVRGLPIESMAVLDTGRSRSLRNFLEIAGEHNATILSATLYNLQQYWETGEIAKGWGGRLGTRKAFLILQEHPGIRVSVSKVYQVNHVLRGGQGRWATIHYILAQIDYEDTEFFFEKLYSGDGLPLNSPILLLRNRLLDARYSSRRAMNQRDFSALAFKAWNLYRTGTTLQQLTFRGGGARPEEYPKPI